MRPERTEFKTNSGSKNSETIVVPEEILYQRRGGKRTFSILIYADSRHVLNSADELTRFSGLDIARMGIDRI